MTEPGPDALLEMLAGAWITQAVATAASLGIGDALAGKSLDAAALAALLGCHAPSLERLLGVLASRGVVTRDLEDRYTLTAAGEELRSGRLRELAIFLGSATQWSPWPELSHTIRTGEAAFVKVHGKRLFDWLAEHPLESAVYDAGIEAFTRAEARCLAERYDFSQVGTVVDVGGGTGTLLGELLAKWPRLRGVLLDLEHAVARARERFASGELAGRATAVAGNFFEQVPEGGDAYVIKHVLHNWDDARATRILERCASAMAPGGRVLVVEAVLLPEPRNDPTRLMDLEMLALTGAGRERTKPEYRTLFRAAGLKLNSTLALLGGTRLLIGSKR